MTLRRSGNKKVTNIPKKIKCKGCQNWTKVTDDNQIMINNVCVIECECGCENEIILY